MAVETNVADSSETVVSNIVNRSDHSDVASEQSASSPDSSCVPDEQQSSSATVQQEMEPHHHHRSVIRLIRPELLIKEEVNDNMTTPPRIDVIVNPQQFQPEFRPVMLHHQRHRVKRPAANASGVVSSSTSPGPSSRTPPPPPIRNGTIMGPPPPPPPPAVPALPALPKNGAGAKSPPGRIRKSTAGTQRRHPADHEEPSSSIPEIGKS